MGTYKKFRLTLSEDTARALGPELRSAQGSYGDRFDGYPPFGGMWIEGSVLTLVGDMAPKLLDGGAISFTVRRGRDCTITLPPGAYLYIAETVETTDY